MKVLVTGATGYIGHVVAEKLCADGHDVVGLDIRPANRPQNFVSIVCDICDREALTSMIRKIGPEIVVHLAAQTDIRGESALSEYPANMEGVENLVAALSEVGTCRRAVYASTQLVCRPGYIPKSSTDYAPHTFYGQSKVRTEEIIRERAGTVSDWCIIRPTSIWGPGMSDHYQTMLRYLQHGRYFHSGTAPLYKSFGYIDNAAFQICKLATVSAEHIAKKTFYIADYEPISLRRYTTDLAKGLNARAIPTVPLFLARAFAKLGDGLNAVGFRSFPFNSFRLNNILTEYRFDMLELSAVCGPTPVTYDEAIARTVSWYKRLSAEPR